MHPVTAFTLVIDPQRCQICEKCQVKAVCQSHAVRRIDPGEPPFIDIDICRGCRVCIRACSYQAVIKLDES